MKQPTTEEVKKIRENTNCSLLESFRKAKKVNILFAIEECSDISPDLKEILTEIIRL